jgi:virginiamycin B lyase
VKVVLKRRLMATCVAGLSLAACAVWSNASAAPAPDAVGQVTARSISELKVTATISVGKVADWIRVTPTSVWVGSKGPFAVNEIDPKTNSVINTVALPGDPCGGIAADAENLWVPLCEAAPATPKLAKIDLKTRKLTVFDVGPGAKEGEIAAGAGSVWMITDAQGSLSRINAASGAVMAVVHVPAGSSNAVYSDGRVWVTRADGAELTVVDAKTDKVMDNVTIGQHPRFVTAGAGAIWTVDQGDGALSRVAIASKPVASSVPIETPGLGGDIAYGDGRIWTTLRKTPLTAVDAARSVVLCQWKGAGGDAVGVGHGAVWLTDLSAGTVMRIALSDFPKECRAAGHGK